jgi:hypothetical protein
MQRTSYSNDFFCVGVMYSGEYDACDVTLSVYPHRGQAYFSSLPTVWIYTAQSNITRIKL